MDIRAQYIPMYLRWMIQHYYIFWCWFHQPLFHIAPGAFSLAVATSKHRLSVSQPGEMARAKIVV